MQDAFATALERWPRDGVPRTPGAWIVTTARNRAIDRIRRDRVFRQKAELLARLESLPAEEEEVNAIPDDRLALVFTCCHPALAAESRVALTLREVGGLTTAEIAHAFLVDRAGDGAAARAREAEDPRRRHPVPRAARPPAPRAAALRARRPLPRLQRGLRGDRRRRPRARRPLRRGDPAREAPRRPHARRAGGARAARADAPPGLTARARARARTASSSCSRTRTARCGTRARIDEGLRMLERAASLRRPGAVPAPGGDRRRARGGPAVGRDRRALRAARRARALAGRRR